MAITTVVRTMRPPFLLLVFSCLSLPLCYSIAQGYAWSLTGLLLIVLSALSSHISVNMLNEYQDAASALDSHTQRTPFSGGSGALVVAPGRRQAVKWTALVMLALTLVSGLTLIFMQPSQGWLLSGLGVVGILIVVSYTPWLNRAPWLCLLAPGIGFGVVMCYGSFVALTGRTDLAMLGLSLLPMLLVNNLLLLNQFPDADADRRHGRRHLVISYGYRRAAAVLAGQWLLTAAVIVDLVQAGSLPRHAVSLLLFLLPAGWIYIKAWRFRTVTPTFVRAMALNVALTLSLPVITGLVLLL